jgi:dienelactone hydrolase
MISLGFSTLKEIDWFFVLLGILIINYTETIFAQRQQLEILDYGQYSVGFQYWYEIDSSRTWEPLPSDMDTNTAGTKYRPMRISVWYPAQLNNENKMRFENYVRPEHNNFYFRMLNKIMTDYDMWSYNGMFNEDSIIINNLLHMETEVYYNAKPAEGKFALVIYSSGWFSRSPDNTLLAEYLASHGYIVVTVPQLGPGSTVFDFKVSPERINTQVADLRFALDFSLTHFNIDTARITALGFSIGGIVALWLGQTDERIKAVIGLDGSFILSGWKELCLNRTKTSVFNFPIIAIHRGHEMQIDNVDYTYINNLTWSERIAFEIPKSTHGEFYDEPYLFNKLNVPWIRTEFNSLEEAYYIHKSVVSLTKLLLDYLTDQKIDTEEQDDLREIGTEYGYNIKKWNSNK